jgi:hypothetical protein
VPRWNDLDDMQADDTLLADRLFGGDLPSDEAPWALRHAAAVIERARTPATREEVSRRGEIVSEFSTIARMRATPAAPARPMRWGTLSGKALLVAVPMMVVGTSVAAATDSLPGPVQDAVATALSPLGISVPDGQAGSDGGKSDQAQSVTDASPKASPGRGPDVGLATPATQGLCTAWRAGGLNMHGRAYRALAAAAGGASGIGTFCASATTRSAGASTANSHTVTNIPGNAGARHPTGNTANNAGNNGGVRQSTGNAGNGRGGNTGSNTGAHTTNTASATGTSPQPVRTGGVLAPPPARPVAADAWCTAWESGQLDPQSAAYVGLAVSAGGGSNIATYCTGVQGTAVHTNGSSNPVPGGGSAGPIRPVRGPKVAPGSRTRVRPGVSIPPVAGAAPTVAGAVPTVRGPIPKVSGSRSRHHTRPVRTARSGSVHRSTVAHDGTRIGSTEQGSQSGG